ncbi:MAG: hypothetical protein J5646_03110 [Bacteroidales bacterium]|nr:hypothetical protein [Bacteroidales bacterium]
MEFAQFILAHEGEDPAQLALARGRFGAEVDDFDLALTTLEVRRKLRDKVPEWYAVPSLRFPLRVSGEQCSSTATARYKAAVLRGGRIADLTGGLGVDSWAFAQVFGEVLYNEMRPELADAAARNFAALGVTNIKVKNYALVSGDSLGSDEPRNDKGMSDPASCPAPTGHPLIPGSDPGSPAASVSQILGCFRPDVIFLDPARRGADGRKVFRLEDCQPDVLQLLPELLAACPKLLLKLSPMADITLVCKQLGCVKEVHVVAADGECKELLLVLEKGWQGDHTLTIVEDGAVMKIPGDMGGIPQSSLRDPSHPCGWAPPSYVAEGGHGLGDATHISETYLFEPGKALLKAAAFELPCRYGLTKLGQHTHLYTGTEVPEVLRPFGKCYRILESAPLDKRSIKAIGQKYLQADVTARNIPLTSDQLRAKLGVRDGGTVHIFGLHADALHSNLLLITERC